MPRCQLHPFSSVSVIKKFLSWQNKLLWATTPFKVLRQALFESIARSCRIRRNPQAFRPLKNIPPISQPASKRPPASSRWSFLRSFIKALSPSKRNRSPRRPFPLRKLSPHKAHNDRKSGHPSPLRDPNNIVYAVPRAEIVDTLNQTLGQTQTQGNTRPISHPEMGHFARPEKPPRPTQASQGKRQQPQSGPQPSNRMGQNLSTNGLDHLAAQSMDRSIDRLERSYADHPDTLEELSDSAYLCECQGRYAEAERLYKQVLTLKQRRLGPDHLEIAATLNDLAALYCLQNRYEAALPLLQTTLTIRQQHLMSHHPDLGETLHQLAKVYRHQEQYGKAEPLFQQALSIFRQQFGGQHPRTQAVYNDLMQMIVTTIEGGNFSELASELPPLDLNTLSETYSWAKPSWQQ